MPQILREINMVKNDHFETYEGGSVIWENIGPYNRQKLISRKICAKKFLDFPHCETSNNFSVFWLNIGTEASKRRSSFMKFVTVINFIPKLQPEDNRRILICFRWQCFQLSKVFYKVVNSGKSCSAKIDR